MKTTFLLIRHGESIANKESFLAGQMDVDLTERGLAQAARTADYIAKNFKADCLYSSDLIRAYQTAQSIGMTMNLPVHSCKDLREIHAGVWQGLTYKTIAETYPEAYAVWQHDVGHCRCPGGESAKEMGERAFSAISRLSEKHPGQTVIVVTHATVLRALESLIKTGSADSMKDIPCMGNASVSVLVCENGNWDYTMPSDVSHLQTLQADYEAKA